MIPSSEIIEMIKEQFPDMKVTCERSKVMQGFECISAYAKDLLDAGNRSKFAELVHFVEECYSVGHGNIKTGIDNVLLYNIGTYIDCSHESRQIRDMLPARMRTVLIRQYGASAL